MFIQNICYIQKILKGVKERKKFFVLKKKKAAVLIQKNFRMFRAKKYYKILKIVNKAAIIIQKYFRGYKARRKFSMMKRVFHQELKRKETCIQQKREKEHRAMKASERLFKGKGIPDMHTTMNIKIERPFSDNKNEKIERIKNIYAYKEDDSFLAPFNEKSALINDIIEELRPGKREKTKGKKSKKRNNMNMTHFSKMKY